MKRSLVSTLIIMATYAIMIIMVLNACSNINKLVTKVEAKYEQRYEFPNS